MFVKAALLWLVGLVTVVPYGMYYLLFQAPRERYALLITLILFWILGYWSVVGPLLAAFKVRAVFRALEHTRSREELLKLLHSPGSRDLAIDYIASENGIPRFLAARVYRMMARALSEGGATSTRSSG
jgi:hypothetical protein